VGGGVVGGGVVGGGVVGGGVVGGGMTGVAVDVGGGTVGVAGGMSVGVGGPCACSGVAGCPRLHATIPHNSRMTKFSLLRRVSCIALSSENQRKGESASQRITYVLHSHVGTFTPGHVRSRASQPIQFPTTLTSKAHCRRTRGKYTHFSGVFTVNEGPMKMLFSSRVSSIRPNASLPYQPDHPTSA